LRSESSTNKAGVAPFNTRTSQFRATAPEAVSRRPALVKNADSQLRTMPGDDSRYLSRYLPVLNFSHVTVLYRKTPPMD